MLKSTDDAPFSRANLRFRLAVWLGVLMLTALALAGCVSASSPPPTATPDIQVTADAAIAATGTATPTATPTATATPTPTPTPMPTATPTVTPTPTYTPTPTPTPIPKGQFYAYQLDEPWYELTALMERYPFPYLELSHGRFSGYSLYIRGGYTLDWECTHGENIYHYHEENTGNVYLTQACFDKYQALCGENYTPELLPGRPGCFDEQESSPILVRASPFDAELLDTAWASKDVLSLDESKELDYLYDIYEEDESAGRQILQMPFVEEIEPSDVLALDSMRSLSRATTQHVLAHPSLRDGITDEWTDFVTILRFVLPAYELQRQHRSFPERSVPGCFAPRRHDAKARHHSSRHEGLCPLQDGKTVEIEIAGIGSISVHVSDPLKRTWERGIYTDNSYINAYRREGPHRGGRRRLECGEHHPLHAHDADAHRRASGEDDYAPVPARAGERGAGSRTSTSRRWCRSSTTRCRSS